MSLPLIVPGGVQLRQLLPEAKFVGIDDLRVQRCVRLVRQVRPGDVWVAMPARTKLFRQAEHFQGEAALAEEKRSPVARGIAQEEAAEAVARGAAAVVTEQPLPGVTAPQVVVPNVREAWGRICQALAGHPSQTLKVIAVGGRLGRVATCWLLRRVLAEAGYRPGLLSSQGRFDGKHWKNVREDIAEPEILASQLAHLVSHQCSHAVVEVSARGLAEHYLAGMKLDVVCLTPFGRAASAVRSRRKQSERPTSLLSVSGDEEHPRQGEEGSHHPWLAAVSERIFRYLTAEGLTVLSADDPVSAECLRFLEGPVLTVGLRQMAEITAHLVEQQSAEQIFLLQAGADVVPVRTRRIGREHRVDCLLATAVGLAYGIELAQVVRGLEAVESVPGHWERIERGQPFGLFLDASGSKMEVHQIVRTLKKLSRGRLWCVAGVEPNQQKKAAGLAEVLPRYVDRLLLTVEKPSSEGRAQAEPAEAKVIRERCSADQALWVADRGEAIWTVLQQAEPGDNVLIFTNMRPTDPAHRTPPLDWYDRQVILGCLESLYPEELPLTREKPT